MSPFIIAQAFGIAGMTLNAISYQAKKQRTIILLQFFGGAFFVINMYMLNAYMGALLNAIGVVRAAVYANKDKIRNLKLCSGLFIAAFLLSYVAVFTVFNKELTLLNILVELLPLAAMTTMTIAFSLPSAQTVRRFALFASPCWLIYNIVNLSIGGILCESFSILSAITALVRTNAAEKKASA